MLSHRVHGSICSLNILTKMTIRQRTEDPSPRLCRVNDLALGLYY